MANSSEKRPNILFAVADDASHFGCYGHAFVKTPSIDSVAERGVKFTQAFTTNPKCAPSRASILTGLHTWQLEEASCHFGMYPKKFIPLPDILEGAGYTVGYTGKGWEPGDWRSGGRDRNPAGNPYQCRKLNPPDGSCIDSCDYAGNFKDFLNDRPEETPFFFWYGGREPHRPYTFGEGDKADEDCFSSDVIPPYWPDEPAIRQDVMDYAYEIEWFDRHLGYMLKELEQRGELDRTMVIVTSDNGAPFPRVKGQMYEADFHLPLIMSWPERIRGSVSSDALVSFIDFFPTILDAAGLSNTEKAVFSKSPTKLPGKSLLDVEGVCPQAEVEKRRRLGISIKSGQYSDPPIKAGEEDAGTIGDFVVMGKERHDIGREGDLGYPVRCIRNKRFLYVRNYAAERWPAGNPETGFTNCDSSPVKDRVLELNSLGVTRYFDLCFGKRPYEELYDVDKDPDCIMNLAEDPQFLQVKNELIKALERVLLETKDPRAAGQGDVFDTYAYVGEDNHSWKRYQNGTWSPQKF